MQRFSSYPLHINDSVSVPAVVYLTDELWDALQEFYKAFLLRHYNDFDKEFMLPEKLRAASEKFFDEIWSGNATTGLESGPMADMFFNNFSAVLPPPGPRNKITWRKVFQFVHAWEKRADFQLSKSALFFSWATDYMLSGDYPSAFMRLHKTLEEDKRRYGFHDVPPTPAMRFITVRPKTDDILYPVTLDMIQFIVDGLEHYRHEAAGTLSYAQLQEKFFDAQDEDLGDIRFYFLFTILKLMKLSENYYTEGLADTRMAPMIFYNVISGLNVISEELFRLVFQTPERMKQSLTFINYMQDIANQHGWTSEQIHYHATISNAHLTRENFADMVEQQLSGTYRTKDNRKLEPMETHLVLTYQLRNFSAHTMQSQKVLWDRFPQILQSVLNTFFFGVEKLVIHDASSIGTKA